MHYIRVQPAMMPKRRETMTVAELIERLQEQPADAEIRLMTQPRYPMQYGIEGVVSTEDYNQDEEDFSAETIVYICEGNEKGYGSRQAFECSY